MKYLIVARHMEDVAWVQECEGWEPLIVQKEVDMPNEGREAASYFWALDKLYPKIRARDRLAFCQGNPYPHVHDIVADLRNDDGDGFRWLGWWDLASDGQGNPDHPGLPIAAMYVLWVGRRWPGEVSFVAAANFIISGRDAKRRPRTEYRRMVDEMCIGTAPWTMERLWGAYFAKPTTS